MLASRGKVLLEVFVPNELILPRDECGKAGQFLRAQFFYGLFYFGQTHRRMLAAPRVPDNQIAAG